MPFTKNTSGWLLLYVVFTQKNTGWCFVFSVMPGGNKKVTHT